METKQLIATIVVRYQSWLRSKLFRELAFTPDQISAQRWPAIFMLHHLVNKLVDPDLESEVSAAIGHIEKATSEAVAIRVQLDLRKREKLEQQTMRAWLGGLCGCGDPTCNRPNDHSL